MKSSSLLFVVLTIFISRCTGFRQVHTFSIKVSSDTAAVSYCQIAIISSGKISKDTFADINGDFSFKYKANLDGFILRSASLYPKYVSISNIGKNTLILLDESMIMKSTGGMGIDTLLLEINDSLIHKFNY